MDKSLRGNIHLETLKISLFLWFFFSENMRIIKAVFCQYIIYIFIDTKINFYEKILRNVADVTVDVKCVFWWCVLQFLLYNLHNSSITKKHDWFFKYINKSNLCHSRFLKFSILVKWYLSEYRVWIFHIKSIVFWLLKKNYEE